jgi:predicted nucleic acid-binding protein
MVARERQLLDACGLINIVAGGRVSDIAEFFGGLVVVDDVAEEAADAAAAAKSLIVVSLTDAESEMLVELARIDGMDAGEAATFAVAAARSLPVVTDDRRAIRAAADHVPHVRVYRTASVLRTYVEGMAVNANDAAAMLEAIEIEASFRPAPGSPDAHWWLSVRESRA